MRRSSLPPTPAPPPAAPPTRARGGAPGARPAGLRLITGYKLVKGAAMLLLAALLTLGAVRAREGLLEALHALAARGALARRLASALAPHATAGALATARWVAWLDGLTTLAEGVLLWRGSPLGEWAVVASAGLLLVPELLALGARPSALKAAVLLLNLAVVAYLVRRRLHPRAGAPAP